MSSLHLVFTSPWAGNALADCLRAASAGDAVLLLQDGVYAAAGGEKARGLLAQARQQAVHVHLLSPDLAARGLQPDAGCPAQAVSDDGFVALTEQHARVVSWF
ncbi:MAG: sulfurtransferase complex subunit TusB [Gammaproteobacteria bacterium]